MKQNILWKWVLVAVVVALCAFFYFHNGLKKGLDLKGGIHLVLMMDPSPSIVGKVANDVNALTEQLRKSNVPFAKIYPTDNNNTIVVEGADPNLGPEVSRITEASMSNYTFSGLGEGKYALTMKKQVRNEIEDGAIAQSVEVIRNRIDKYGVAEPVIKRQGLGSNKIVVELPGVEDSTEVKRLIGKAAQLAWHLEVEPVGGLSSQQAVIDFFKGQVPPDVTIFQGSTEKYGGERWFALKTVAPVSGADIQQVQVGASNLGQPVVEFQLTPAAGRKFKEFTGANIKNRLAIVLDNVVITDPSINAEIEDKGIIEGNFTQKEAKELVFQLKSGALPALPKFAEERTVGPSLGLDSIKKGSTSGLIGLVAVFIFMLAYYRLSGINAIVTLVLNFVILMGVMSVFGMTLTVPGIAGIILTLGTAVDANVLNFERIKDELLDNKAIRPAVAGGFGKAFITIFDSHLTNIISALFLLQFGTGPVRGFAVTLTVGLLASIFTAVFISRLIYESEFDFKAKGGAPVNSLSIGPINSLRGSKIPFMKYKLHLVIISLVLITVGMVSLFTRGLNLGIDFRGGQEIQIRFTKKVDPRATEEMLRTATQASLTVVSYGKPEDNELLVRLEAKDDKGQLLSEEALAKTIQAIYDSLRSAEAKTLMTSGMTDLNSVTSQGLRELILSGIRSGTISGTEDAGKALAQAILDHKKNQNGIIASMDSISGVTGMTPAMLGFLKTKAFVGDFSVLRVDTVGPTVGKELQNKAIYAIVGSLLGILLYAWFRFQFRFSMGAVLSLVHDALMTVGLLSIFQVEVNLPTIAAILTVLGYSIHDTIVVFDRIREHMRKTRKQEDDQLFDQAINETLSRTMITSMLTFFVVLAMLIFGGEVLYSFAFVMVAGILVGTYSSIFIASPYVLWWNKLGIARYFAGSKKK